MQKKILIIEDEYDIASTMELSLEMDDHEVRLTSNGREALNVLENEALPHLIISDIMMPIMDGYEFTRELRENKRFSNIPLILTSAAQLNQSLVNKKDYQAFLKKPFDLENFLETVSKIVS